MQTLIRRTPKTRIHAAHWFLESWRATGLQMMAATRLALAATVTNPRACRASVLGLSNHAAAARITLARLSRQRRLVRCLWMRATWRAERHSRSCHHSGHRYREPIRHANGGAGGNSYRRGVRPTDSAWVSRCRVAQQHTQQHVAAPQHDRLYRTMQRRNTVTWPGLVLRGAARQNRSHLAGNRLNHTPRLPESKRGGRGFATGRRRGWADEAS